MYEIEKKQTWTLWFKVIVAVLPAAIIGLIFEDLLDKTFYKFVPVAIALIVYGVLFIIIERINKNRKMKYETVYDIDYPTALKIGCFQVLSLIPGTSRSGSTILGASTIKVSRTAAAEFSFFLAIPVMFGVSFLKIITNDYVMTGNEWTLLIIAMVVAYVVSMIAVKFLVSYVRRHDFTVFGWYRIALGVIVLAYHFIPMIIK